MFQLIMLLAFNAAAATAVNQGKIGNFTWTEIALHCRWCSGARRGRDCFCLCWGRCWWLSITEVEIDHSVGSHFQILPDDRTGKAPSSRKPLSITFTTTKRQTH
uniref:Putative secreted protein n=1 Tax=Anopheles marajoara TaxID=58244 RepID=A0A2M4C8G8_9DIPT